MGTVLVGRQLTVVNISSLHPRFKIYRKQLQSGLNSRATQTYLPLIAAETRVLLSSLASSPENFISHIRRCNTIIFTHSYIIDAKLRNSGAVTLKIAYGWSVSGNDDYFIKLVEEVFKIMSELLRPGQWLVDDFPWLRFVPAWVPGAGLVANAREYFGRVESIPFNWAKEQIVSSFITSCS